MLTTEMHTILSTWKETGWVPEPAAKRLFALAGFDVPRFIRARSAEEACRFAGEIGYPVVVKIFSPRIVHKSDVGGVETGVADEAQLRKIFDRFSSMDGFDGVVVDEQVPGVELIVGATVDAQFGPVILLGVGGVGVELYKDTAIRMAPLEPKDVRSMVNDLTARRLFEGFRGSEPVNIDILSNLVVPFSRLVMELESRIESIDLNPVLCTAKRCVIADARIMLS